MKTLIYFSTLCTLLLHLVGRGVAQPNILWITAEDMSATLGCYGDTFATTPNIDTLAQRSVRYTHAFATAPVCSPSRSCLINGLPATSQGTQQMRSAFPIPADWTGFPSLLRQAGYFTSNNVKTDYNSANFEDIIAASWDRQGPDAHWRQAPKDKPFFSIFNLMTSHQSRSMVWPYAKFQSEVQSTIDKKQIHDPGKVTLPSYYPDTGIIRKTVARFYDCVTAMDKEVGTLLTQLEEDGLADNTIVFFYSDHGSGMPRHKRALLDSGMHVPLIIHAPKKYKHLVPGKAGSTNSRLVNFADFAPTVLNLTGIKPPNHMEGRPFLGKNSDDEHTYVFGHRDRVDEVLDCARSVRGKRYLYIRNFMPHLGYNQPTAWPDLGEIRHEFYATARISGGITPGQRHFLSPTRPIEELYDCEKDPENLNNLAKSKTHLPVLKRMRIALEHNILKTHDLGFLPEAYAWDWSKGSTPYKQARLAYDLDAIYAAANQVGIASNDIFINHLNHKNPAIRYWGAVGLCAADDLQEDDIQALKEALRDNVANVRIQAADALARHGHASATLAVLASALKDKNLSVVQHAARTIELMGHQAKALVNDVRACDARMKVIRPPGTSPVVVQPDKDMAMFIGFSTEAFLAQHGEADAGWKNLFDGKTLTGWEARAKGEVSIVDNEIHILAKGANLWLVHEDSYDNFELEVDVHVPESGYNSGIGFRCSGEKKPIGYQCEVDRKKSGSIYAIGKGWVLPHKGQDWNNFYEAAGSCFKDNEWNTFKIRCDGEHIQIWVNGHKTADVKDQRFSSGAIALQHHGKGAVHRFRNVKIRPL